MTNTLRRILAVTLAVLALTALAAGCVVEDDGGDEQQHTPQTMTQFTDSAGRTVELPAQIARVSPSGVMAQQFLLALAPDLLVSNSSEYSANELRYLPGAVAELPVTGSFYGSGTFNPESAANLRPDIVIDVGELRDSTVEDMDGITADLVAPAVFVEATLHTAPEAFRTLGRILGREERAEQLAQYCESVLELTLGLTQDKTSILFLLGDAGQNVLARGSFHSEALDAIALNIAVVDNPSSRGTGNEANMETIYQWDPEVIIFAPGSVFADVAGDPVWQPLRAVSSGRYYEVPLGPYNWMGSPPSINRYLGMLWLAELLYPALTAYDIEAMVIEYYALFYHYELSAQEYAALVANSLGKM